MSLLDRFMGQPDPDSPEAELIANAALENPPSYVLLFPKALDLDADALTLALQSYHPTLSRAKAELMDVSIDETSPDDVKSVLGLAGWDNHVIKLVGFDAPIPPQLFETCVRPAHCSPDLKRDALQHESHLLLYYAGRESDPLEQYVALTVVAAVLARFDALLLLNENARTAFPAEALLAEEPDHDALEMLRSMPIPLLYGGFVKVEVEGEAGVWMRTFGNKMLNLPDLAFRAEGHHQGSETFDLFANVLAYVRESGQKLGLGHTMQVGEDIWLRLRQPAADEWHYLHSDGEMFVAERVAASDVQVRP